METVTTHASVTVSETTAPQTRKPVWKSRRKLILIMAKHPEICCIILAMFFSLFSNYAKRAASAPAARYKSQPLPRPFFSSSSLILDFPYGNLGDVATLLEVSEVLVVMYYAPWCAQSSNLKLDFEKAARYLEPQHVRFASINCWYVEGSCRKRNFFPSFPQIFIYHTHLDGFRYNGVLQADYIIRFIEKFLYPLKHIKSEVDLDLLLATADNAVVGYFNFNESPQPPGYQQYYFAALRTLTTDPNNVIEFGLITNAHIADQLHLQNSNLSFWRSNSKTLIYPSSLNFTSKSIVQWVMQNRQEETVHWLLPSETKSLLLSTELNKGPAIILFTSNSPLAKVNVYHSQLREIALDYKNCQYDRKMVEMIQTSVYSRRTAILNDIEHREQCRRLRQNLPMTDKGDRYFVPKPLSTGIPLHRRISTAKQCCASTLFRHTRTGNTCDICINYDWSHPNSRHSCHILSLHTLPMMGVVADDVVSALCNIKYGSCIELRPTYHPGEFVTVCCDNSSLSKQRILPSRHRSPQNQIPPVCTSTDPFVATVVRDHQKEACEKTRWQRLFGWLSQEYIPQVEDEKSATLSTFTGLSCQSNRTVNFYVMDSTYSNVFLERLGLDRLPNKESVILLVDKEKELHYLMEDIFKKEKIENFLHNFTMDMLERYHISSPIVRPCSGYTAGICIHEDVVLLYYTPWCGFCSAFSSVFLALAKYFQTSKTIMFARINIEKNDLPWELMADSYPTITIYPASRKKESITFPDDLEKNLPNMIKFVLEHVDLSARLDSGMNVCSNSCIQHNIEQATAHIEQLRGSRQSTINHIDQVDNKLRHYDHGVKSTDTLDQSTAPFQHMAYLQQYLKFLSAKRERIDLLLVNLQHLIKILKETRGLSITRSNSQFLVDIYKKLKDHTALFSSVETKFPAEKVSVRDEL